MRTGTVAVWSGTDRGGQGDGDGGRQAGAPSVNPARRTVRYVARHGRTGAEVTVERNKSMHGVWTSWSPLTDCHCALSTGSHYSLLLASYSCFSQLINMTRTRQLLLNVSLFLSLPFSSSTFAINSTQQLIGLYRSCRYLLCSAFRANSVSYPSGTRNEWTTDLSKRWFQRPEAPVCQRLISHANQLPLRNRKALLSF